MTDLQTGPEATEAEALEQLEASLSTETEAWRPEPGEVLSGTIVGIEMRTSDFGPYPGVTIRKLDGEELVFHAFRTVALNELKRLKPVVGDKIAVLYVGPTSGGDYHGYKIRVSREVGGEFDWDGLKVKERPKDNG